MNDENTIASLHNSTKNGQIETKPIAVSNQKSTSLKNAPLNSTNIFNNNNDNDTRKLLKQAADITKLSSDDGDASVTILHFNDCYNIEPSKSSSGAAGFVTAIRQYQHLNPMILFSGDILSPSFMSTFTKGEQMIPVLNAIGVDCAVYGNHEFDYGVDNLIEFAKQTNFPWLLSNAIDKETSNQLGDGQVYHIIERNGFRFGLIGLIEQEWLSSLSTLEVDDVIYKDFVTKGRELAVWLKSELHVDYVIALTHFRTPNDIRLSDSVPEVDLILGGHDHEYEVIKRPNSYIIKSGTDFREFSKITLRVNSNICKQKKVEQQDGQNHQHSKTQETQQNHTQTKIKIGDKTNIDTTIANANHNYPDADVTAPNPATSSNCLQNCINNKTTTASSISKRASGPTVVVDDKNVYTGVKEKVVPFSEIMIEHVECLGYEEEPELKKKLEKFQTSIDSKMGQVLGQFSCDLDGRFSSIRKNETNLGNFVTDIMLASTHADLAILNSGTLRSDRIHPKGDFTMRDLFNILGYIDPIAVLKASGWHIWQALENGVSAWPKLEGRFPQVSGCSFAFDPSKPPMKRIDPSSIMIGEEVLEFKKEYKLTTKAYLASGKDGYDMLKECEILVPGDESPDLTTSILNHFESIKILKSNRRTHHRQSVICLSRSTLRKIYEDNGNSPTSLQDQNSDHHQHLEQTTDVDNSQIAPSLNGTFDSPNNNCNNKCLQEKQTEFVNCSPNSVMSTPTQVPPSLPATPTSLNHRKLKRITSLSDLELEMCKLEPKIEGRIRILSN